MLFWTFFKFNPTPTFNNRKLYSQDYKITFPNWKIWMKKKMMKATRKTKLYAAFLEPVLFTDLGWVSFLVGKKSSRVSRPKLQCHLIEVALWQCCACLWNIGSWIIPCLIGFFLFFSLFCFFSYTFCCSIRENMQSFALKVRQ